jgi:hypothetical protein
MADQSDVEEKLKALIAAVVYPSGTSSPSIIGVDTFIYRGWPKSAQLDTDLSAGKCHISIYPPPGMERNTPRYGLDDTDIAPPAHTITAVVSGNQVTIGGTFTPAVPQNVIIIAGGRYAFPYSAQSGDTPASIATALAALIAVGFPGSSAAGPVITVAGRCGILQARVAGQGQSWQELGRQEKTFMITCWCSTPAQRDQLAPPVDVALRKLPFITLPDQGAARLRYASTRSSDEGEKVQIYRRDLLYTVEYATSLVTPAYEVGAIGLTTNPGAGGSPQTIYS